MFMPYYHDIKLDDKVFWGTKHKGKKVKEVIEQDPDYIAWCINTISNFHLNQDAFSYYWQVLEDEDENNGYPTLPPLTLPQRDAILRRIDRGEKGLLLKAREHFTLSPEDENVIYLAEQFKKIQ